MKTSLKHILIIPFMILGGFLTSCDEGEEINGGEPVVHYVRVTNPSSSDSLLVSAYLGNLIAVMGDNLGNTKELWFNDQKAILNPVFVTDKSILVRVPNVAPGSVTNEMKLVFGNGQELVHEFEVAIADPIVEAMKHEYGPAGITTEIYGNFFFAPLSVTFTGGAEAEIVSVDQNLIEIIIPEGAEPGPITVTTNFGSTESVLHYKDQRNIILNYDDLTAAGSWRPGTIASEDGIDGNYLRLFGSLDANERAEDNLASQFWGHTRFPEPTNLVTGIVDNQVLKFEARVVEWNQSYLQITWGPYDNAGNQEYWTNMNARGLWGPWEDTGSTYSTDGEWITVTIPFSEMKYSHNQNTGDNAWPEDMTFDKDISGTLSFWVIATKDADASPVEIHIDNVRIVER